MVDEKILAKVFRAAAVGQMAPYGRGGMFSSGSYDAACSLAGSFDAIASIFENMAKAEDETTIADAIKDTGGVT